MGLVNHLARNGIHINVRSIKYIFTVIPYTMPSSAARVCQNKHTVALKQFEI